MVININKKISRILYHTSKTIRTGIPRIIKENVIYDIEIKLLHYDTHIITNQYILQNVNSLYYLQYAYGSAKEDISPI